MKIKTRLAIAFITITVVPIFLIYGAITALSNYQIRSFQKTYGLSEQVDLLSGNSMQVFNRLTINSQKKIRHIAMNEPDKLEDPECLAKVNEALRAEYSFLLVRKGPNIIFSGDPEGEKLFSQLPPYGEDNSDVLSGGFYVDGEEQHLLKQIDFQYGDRSRGSAFIVTNVGEYVPEIKSMLNEMLIVGIAIICLTGGMLVMWVYRSILRPLHELQEATKKIRDGNLDFTLDAENDDEIGMLCQDFEEMRLRLKESAEEKIQYDKESKELISNISHDLKTPITAIKGICGGNSGRSCIVSGEAEQVYQNYLQ